MPSKNHCLTLESLVTFCTCPGLVSKLCSGERQQVVGGSVVDHSAIKVKVGALSVVSVSDLLLNAGN